MATKLKQLYTKKNKEKKKDNKKKTPALFAFLAPCPITTALASYLLATNNKTAVTNTGKKINLHCLNKFWLKTLIKKGRCFIYKK